jgi:diaminopimelate epimerase
MKYDFYKFQGTGNDFVMIEDWNNTFDQNKTLIEKICNRRFGVGADGLILLQTDSELDFYMKYFNSDGNESSMCGNGGRCIAAFYHMLKDANERLLFNAIDGTHEAILVKQSAHSWYVRLKMIDVNVLSLRANDYVLNTGSPHYVRVENNDLKDLPLIDDATKIRYSDEFKKDGINVNFVNMKGTKSIAIRTYERGVEAETLSCGTGATASALVTALYNQFPSGDYAIQTLVQGGALEITYHFDAKTSTFNNVWLCGPANYVFKGQLDTTRL